MSGGISQLVATGAQDVHLVGDPQVSFFRSNYKRHTNFSAIRARQVIQGNPAVGGMSTVRFEKKGDLLSYTYLTAMDGTTAATIDAGDISYIELYIGGQIIDTQYPDYSTSQWTGLEAPDYAKATSTEDRAYPLHFFFCDNWTNALPLVALQYHDVEIRIYWKKPDTSYRYQCWSNFIYLDEAERTYFAENTQNMLIKQVQRSVFNGKKVQNFSFNHPVLYIGSPVADDKLTGGGATSDIKTSLQFNINGVQSGEEMSIDPHYRQMSGYYHSPDCFDGSKFCIPFALNLCSNQPSGSLNFSRLDSSRLEIMQFDSTLAVAGTGTAGTFPDSGSLALLSSGLPDERSFYAVNWNVLKIENGMGGLMYSN